MLLARVEEQAMAKYRGCAGDQCSYKYGVPAEDILGHHLADALFFAMDPGSYILPVEGCSLLTADQRHP